VDPITSTCTTYDEHLRSGGKRHVLSGSEQRSNKRVLHPSSILLCDRRAAYDVMRDTGVITPDLPSSKYGGLDFRIGNVLEEFAAEAMFHASALKEYQVEVNGTPWLGRIDMVVDPIVLGATTETVDWLVEMKTSKVGDPSKLKSYYPKPFHIAQATRYQELLGKPVRPVLYYVTRSNWSSLLFTWEWDSRNGDCDIKVWDDKIRMWKAARTWPGLRKEYLSSINAIENWFNGGELPGRVGSSPDEHEFLCAEKEWRGGDKITPTCPYFVRCWERPAKPFVAGTWQRSIKLPF
jgi:hypothetical protein